MMDLIPPGLKSSSVALPLAALDRLYEEADAACQAFLDAARAGTGMRDTAPMRDLSRFGCPEGCGSCCERFVPDIQPLEADYAALWILRNRPELASVQARAAAPCPYYAPDRPEAHCRIYGGRPLICRLFGFAAMSDKEGRRSYSLCWRMPGLAGRPERSWEGNDLETALGAVPPLMADFGFRLQGLSSPAPFPRPLIGEAIGDSLTRLRFLMALAGDEDNDPGAGIPA